MKQIALKIQADAGIIHGVELLKSKLGISIEDSGITVKGVSADKLSVTSDDGVYTIAHSNKVEFFRGLAIVADSLRKGSFTPVYSEKHFDMCGAMYDMSRNAVFTVDTVKDFLEYMAVMGLNMMMLYTEDTYEIDEYPMFGFMRGKYTKDELRELDAYANALGIELIPCIQTLSHLETTLGWGYASKFRNTMSTLYVGKEETYDFIETMFKTVKECFSTKRIHIGLDEAMDVSFGKRFKEKGYTPPFELMIEHVQRVCKLAAKYGFEPMMWSDMFFKNGILGGDYDRTSEIPEGTRERLPQNIEMVYWDYCYEDSKVADYFIKRHQQELGRKTIFAGGVWTWNRLIPSFVKTMDTARGQLKACKENGVREVFTTIWANTCAPFNYYSTLPGLQMYAEQMYNTEVSDEQLSYMFEVCTGYKYEDFMCLGLDDFSKKDIEEYGNPGAFCINSSAQHFFNDIMMGLYDKTLSGYDFKSHYRKCIKALEQLGDMGKFNDMFNQTELLAKILFIKSTIGPEITEAYIKGEVKKLNKLCSKLKELLCLYKEYHALAARSWHKTNKPFGWEGADSHLAIMEARVENAISRVTGYLDGTYDSLPELEEERIYFAGQEKPLTETNMFKKIISVCAY